jgi:hypothetical protein
VTEELEIILGGTRGNGGLRRRYVNVMEMSKRCEVRDIFSGVRERTIAHLWYELLLRPRRYPIQ